TTVTHTSFDTTARGANFWFVTAHASCDTTKTASTPLHTFTAAQSTCGATPAVGVAAPANGAANVATTVDLTWTVTGGTAESIDVYFGTASDPPLLRAGLAGNTTLLTLPALVNGTKYYWRVAAKSACFPNGATSPVASFTTRACGVPGAMSITFAPAIVTAGATYGIVWNPAPGLDADG